MATALHIAANLVWRAQSPEARIKKAAALRLLTEPHYRLPLEELSRALVSSPGLGHAVPELAQLRDVFSSDACFSHSGVTGNVLLDAATLLTSGKNCLKELIDRTWDSTSSPLAWARNQAAWYIVSRQQLDMHASDLFLAPADDLEIFLAGAWSSRMVLREGPSAASPYNSLEELLAGETCLELVHHPGPAVKLVFSALLRLQPQPQPLYPAMPQSQTSQHHPDANTSGGGAAGGSRSSDGRMSGSGAGQLGTSVYWGEAPGGYPVGGTGGTPSPAVLQPVGYPLQQQPHPPAGGYWADDDVVEEEAAADGAYVDEVPYEGEDEQEGLMDDEDGAGGGGAEGSSRGGPPGGGPARGLYPTGDGSSTGAGAPADADGGFTGGAGGRAASGSGAAGAGGSRGQPWPLRPDLLSSYVRAVFGGPGAADQLMAVVALALVDAGRSATAAAASASAGGGGGMGGGGQFEPLRFRLRVSRLVAHVRDTAPHLLPPPPPPPPGGGDPHHGSGAGGDRAAAELAQRLQERSGRGCFRVLSGGSAELLAAEEQGGLAGDSGEPGEGPVAVLDLEALRGHVVDALTAAAASVFPTHRLPDLIRRTAAAHLASRTKSIGGRAHCVRLTTLSRHLAAELPHHYDPKRLGGLVRMVDAEASANVMHVFKRVPPPSMQAAAAAAAAAAAWGPEAGWARGAGAGAGGGPGGGAGGSGGDEVVTFVTLNVGKLLAAAGIHDLDWVGAGSGPGGGGRGGHWSGSVAADKAAMAVAASRAAAAASAAVAGSGGYQHPHHSWSPRSQSQSQSQSVGSDAHSSSPRPPPPLPPSAESYPGSNAGGYANGGGSRRASQPSGSHSGDGQLHSYNNGGAGGVGGSQSGPPSEAALAQAITALFPPGAGGGGEGGTGGHSEPREVVAAVKRTAALSLAKALHTQPGGLLPLSRLGEILANFAPSAPPLDSLLAEEPDLFELQEHWPGGPWGVRLRPAGVMARAARGAPSPRAHTNSYPVSNSSNNLGSSGSGPQQQQQQQGAAYYQPQHPHNPQQAQEAAPPGSGGDTSLLPQRPGAPNCAFYMRHGTCGFGASCKYNHPPTQRQGGQADAPTGGASGGGPAGMNQRSNASAGAAAASYPAAPPPPPQQQQQHTYQQQASGGTGASTGAHLAPAAGGMAHGSGSAAGGAAAGAGAAAAGAAAAASLGSAALPPAPAQLEVKLVTTLCTPDHLDMLSHCFKAEQIAVACKVGPAPQYSHSGSEAPSQPPCLVQLYAPAVLDNGAAGTSTAEGGHGGLNSSDGSPGATGGGGGAGSGGSRVVWPATVYLVDPLAAGDQKGSRLLESLCALLEDANVPKVVYCGREVLPAMCSGCGISRVQPLKDVSVLYAMVTAAAAAATIRYDPDQPPPPLPPLAAMLQQAGVVSGQGAAAMAAAPTSSRLWSARPLSSDLRQQAVLEVVHLAALWGGLLTRLTALPQQLSQATADAIIRDHAAHASGSGSGTAAAAAAAPPPPHARPTVQPHHHPLSHPHPHLHPHPHPHAPPPHHHHHPHHHAAAAAAAALGPIMGAIPAGAIPIAPPGSIPPGAIPAGAIPTGAIPAGMVVAVPVMAAPLPAGHAPTPLAHQPRPMMAAMPRRGP